MAKPKLKRVEDRCKGMADGATTISEAVDMIRAFARRLEDLQKTHELEGEVEDDYLFLVPKS